MNPNTHGSRGSHRRSGPQKIDTSSYGTIGNVRSRPGQTRITGSQPKLNQSGGMREISLVSARAQSRASHNASHRPVRRSHGTKNGHAAAPSSYREREWKKGKARRVIVIAVAILAAALLAGFVTVSIYLSQMGNALSAGITDTASLSSALVAPASDTAPYWVLIEGDDGLENEGSGKSADADASTECVMLARVDPVQKDVYLLSVPIDLSVDLSSAGSTGRGAIGQARSLGGDAGLVSTVSSALGIDISHYVRVDHAGLAALVAHVGGIEVDVASPVSATAQDGTALLDMDGGEAVDIQAGSQVLDGNSTLVFCTAQGAENGEVQRDANQRVAVQALAEKLLSTGSYSSFSAASTFSSNVSCDMTLDQIVDAANTFSGMGIDRIYSYALPTETSTSNGKTTRTLASITWSEMREVIDEGGIPESQSSDVAGVESAVYDNPETTVVSDVTPAAYTVCIRNGGGVLGSATAVRDLLSTAGYQIGETGNTSQQVYDTTFVIYGNDAAIPAAKDIIKRLGQGTLVQSAGRYTFEGDVLVVTGADWK